MIGAKRGLEKTIFKKTAFKSYFLPVGQLHSSVGRLTQMWSLLKMPYCFLKSFFILLKHRPVAVMGVGGYASGPLCLTSVFLKIPTYVWEGNATPGVTNKILGRFKVLPFLVFKEASKYFKKVKPILTGVPVRKNLEENSLNSKRLAKKTLSSFETTALSSSAVIEDTDTKKNKNFRVLFVGGSQGAKIFNETLPKYVKTFGLEGFHFTHQTGLKNYESVVKHHSKNPNLEVLAYLDPIIEYYLKADLIVSRSGAGAVNEFSLLSKASVLVPFPKASDNHQLKNAEALVTNKSALMIEESEFTPERLNTVLL